MIISIYTLIRKEISRFLKLWPQTVAPSFFSIVVYFLLFKEAMGRTVSLIEINMNYACYIAYSLVLMQIMQISFSAVSASFFNMKYQRSILYLFTTPINSFSVIISFVLIGIIRSFLVCGLAYFAFALFKVIPFSFNLNVILFLLIISATFSLMGLLNAIFSKNFDNLSIFQSFILSPLIYLSGIFYPTEAMSPFFRNLSVFNPCYYIVRSYFYFISLSKNQGNLFNILILFIPFIFLYVISFIIINNKREKVSRVNI